jgi:hypothetical protein
MQNVWGDQRCVQGFGGDHLEDPDIDGRSGIESMDWIELFQDRDRWRTLVNSVTNLLVSYNAGNFLTS